MRPSSVLRTLFKARTIVNPTKYDLVSSARTAGFSPTSLLLLTTPECSEGAVQEVQYLSQELPHLQIVLSETLSSRYPKSIAELWLGERMDVNKLTPHAREDTRSKKWEFVKSRLGIDWLSGQRFDVPVADGTTLQGPGVLSCQFIVDEKMGDASWMNLKELEVGIPLRIREAGEYHSMRLLETECDLYLESVDANVLRSISGHSAAGVLMGLLDKKGIRKAVDVFARLTQFSENDEVENANVYKVIAGGGEWGAGAEIIVLEDADLSPDRKIKVEFLIVDPDDVAGFEVEKGLFLEQVPLESYLPADDLKESDHVIEDLFGLGAADGFEVNGLKCTSQGQTHTFDVDDSE